MDYQSIITEIYNEVNQLNLKGQVAAYIPELANVDKNKFGICLYTTKGESYHIGDSIEKFSIQSISKVFTLAMAYQKFGENMWSRVGVEPSGNPFNSLIRLEAEKGIPRNPLINSGALVVTDMLIAENTHAFKDIIRFMNEVSGCNDITFNTKTAHSELEHSSLNKALAHFMASYNNIECSVSELITTYCYQCSIEMTCEELAKAFLLFANGGTNFFNKQQVLTKSQTKRTNAVMQTCGFYDEAGEFAFKVGLPGKSGVGGGIAAILPGEFSVAVWSPELNEKGNSQKGMKALELLTTKLGYSVF